VLAAIAGGLGHLGEPHGIEWLLRLHRHPDAGVRDVVADALAARSDPRAIEALIELSSDPDPAIRDWATFALGALGAPPTPPRCARRWRRGSADADPDTVVEAIHGLALRGDTRAAEAALRQLAGGAARSLWTRHALEEATIRLAALTGDARFAAVPADGRRALRGTTLEEDLRRARERCGGSSAGRSAATSPRARRGGARSRAPSSPCPASARG
jgi:HEAT repeat protein